MLGRGRILGAGGASVARSAQPGVVSPFNRWTPGAPWHERLSLPAGKHVDQTPCSASTPLRRPAGQGGADMDVI